MFWDSAKVLLHVRIEAILGAPSEGDKLLEEVETLTCSQARHPPKRARFPLSALFPRKPQWPVPGGPSPPAAVRPTCRQGPLTPTFRPSLDFPILSYAMPGGLDALSWPYHLCLPRP